MVFEFCIDRQRERGSNSLMGSIAENIRLIRERIAKAADRAGRAPEDIALLAISKTFPVESIGEAAEAGLRLFGENRVQEAERKIPALSGIPELEWHLVGHLQTNKAGRAAELFKVIHSVDSVKLALKLNQASLALGKVSSVLLQVDLGGEPTKFGAETGEIKAIIAAIQDLPGLRIDGLMTIPPYLENPDEVRPFFARLGELSRELESERPGCLGQKHLSMGMSHDFEQAIEEGSTIVRIGTAIFGVRQ
jgi:PLP dependent protein